LYGILDVNGNTIIQKSSLDSSNATSGAMTVAGGVGIARSLNVGGDMGITGKLDCSGNQKLHGSLDVNGINMNNTLKIIGTSSSYTLININGEGDLQITPPPYKNVKIYHSPDAAIGLSVSGSITGGGILTCPTGYITDISSSTITTDKIKFNPNDTDVMYIQKNTLVSDRTEFAVYIGDNGDTSSITIPTTGTNVFDYFSIRTPSYIHHLFTSTGNYTAANMVSAVSFNSTSDYREKTNVMDLDEYYDVLKLRPVSFEFTKNNKKSIGFIAHEVGEHFEYLVEGQKDGETRQTINYDGIIPILTYNIQELKKKVEKQQEQIEKQQEQIEKQQEQIEKLIEFY